MALKLRPEVRRFAEAMERKLRTKDRRGTRGWQSETTEWLFGRLANETLELHEEIIKVNCASSVSGKVKIAEEAIDVANFAMMIWDKNDYS